MIKQHRSNKSHQQRTIYKKKFNLCPICKKNKGKSKKFNSLYQLLYHLRIHDFEDEVESGVTADDVRKIVKYIVQAMDLGMFVQGEEHK